MTTYMASGFDANTTIWSVEGEDAGDFGIPGGELSFLSAPDYENPTDADGDKHLRGNCEGRRRGQHGHPRR